jgi:hypothetical protein
MVSTTSRKIQTSPTVQGTKRSRRRRNERQRKSKCARERKTIHAYETPGQYKKDTSYFPPVDLTTEYLFKKKKKSAKSKTSTFERLFFSPL